MAAIIIVPSPLLRQPAKLVEKLDKRVLKVIEDMIKTLKQAKDPRGVGLAAPQIGQLWRIFLIRPIKNGPITVFINPEITHYSQRTTHPTSKKGVFEGCLSLPNHYAPVKRSASVTVKYQKLESGTYNLVPAQETYSGFAAHIIQHEMDHLNGILFIDRVLEQNSPLYKTEGKTWTQISL